MSDEKEQPIAKDEDYKVRTVTGIEDAERLQKQGWLLISVKEIGRDEENMSIKQYEFTKEES